MSRAVKPEAIEMAKKFMYVCLGVLALAIAFHFRGHQFFAQPLVVALASVGLGGLIVQRVALRWQHAYWREQQRITRSKEIRERIRYGSDTQQ